MATGDERPRDEACPVCGQRHDGRREVLDCDWGAPGLSPGLDRAQRERDLRAVRRAAGDPTKRARYSQRVNALGPLVRGGPATEDEVAATADNRARVPALPPPDDVLRDALEALTEGSVPMICVIGVGTDGVVEERVTAGPGGSPRLLDEPRMWWWSTGVQTAALAAGQPASPPRQAALRFHLAGGVGPEPFPLPAVLAELSRFIRRKAQRGARVILVDRAGGWPIPAAAIAHLEGLYPGVAVTRAPTLGVARGKIHDYVGAQIRHTPLRLPYGLVVAEVHSAGAVRLACHELFAADTQVDADQPVTRRVRVSSYGRREAQLTLAVVERAGEVPRDWEELAVQSTAFAPGEDRDVVVEVRGPRDVRIVEPGPGPGPAVSYRAALAATPDRIDVTSFDVAETDVVFAIELAGEASRVLQRVALVANTLEVIANRHPDPRTVRARVIGYIDHPPSQSYLTSQGAAEPRVLESLSFDAPDAATKAVNDKWANRTFFPPPTSYQAAPLEDALAEAAASTWRPAARRALVVVGARPPHPAPGNTAPPGATGPGPCPHGYDWHEALRRLAGRGGITRVAVWDPPRWARPASPDPYGRVAREFWQDLPTGTLLSQLRADADAVAGAAGLLPPHQPVTLPFPVLSSP